MLTRLVRSSHNHPVIKKPISVTLTRDDLLWFRAQTASKGCRSVSQMLYRLILEARNAQETPPSQSVVGTVRLDPSDPDLLKADAVLQALFAPG